MDMDTPIIMVVDDDDFFCTVVTSVLKHNYDVKTFTHGEEAIKYLSDHVPDLILLDYEMPNIKGYGVLMAIRTDLRTRNVPVLFLTGVTNARMEMEMMERGANGYIRKPLDAPGLLQEVAKQLKKG